MENFSELIKNRRSMRKFTEEELSQEQVVTLLKAALMSPTSKRSNSWQFIAVDDKEILKQLAHCKEQASSFIADAALAIVVIADPLASDVWIEDASIASILIQLQAEDLGLGSCWVQVRERQAANGSLRMNLYVKSWIFLCNFRFFPSSPLGIKVWNASLSTRTICNGKKFISINSEGNNRECCQS